MAWGKLPVQFQLQTREEKMIRSGIKYLIFGMFVLLSLEVRAADTDVNAERVKNEVSFRGLVFVLSSRILNEGLASQLAAAGTDAVATPAALAAVTVKGFGFFVGDGVVISDKIHLDGRVIDDVDKPSRSIPFKGILTIKQFDEGQAEGISIRTR